MQLEFCIKTQNIHTQEKNMFNTITNSTIDMVTLAKKSFVDFAIPQESLKEPLNKFIDTQTQYTKNAADTFTKVNTQIASLFMGKTLYTETLDIFQENLNTMLGKKGK